MNITKYLTLLALVVIHQGLYPMGAPEAAAGVAGVASVWGAPLKIFLKTLTLAQAGREVVNSIQQCVHSIKSIHKETKPLRDLWEEEFNEQEHFDRQEERLRANATLRAAQERMITKALNLALTISSPVCASVERMQALFALNRIKLLGNRGRVYDSFLAIMNSHYFRSDGTLKSYDPSKWNNERPHRIHELDAFLKTFCKTKNEYLGYLKNGIDQGISTLKQQYSKEQATSRSWKEYHYDISASTIVTQETVINNNFNADFFKAISYCESGNFALARDLIDHHRTKHSSGMLCKHYEIIKHYCEEARSLQSP